MRGKLVVVRWVVAFLVAVSPVLAVTNGRPDGNGHPYVGLAIQFIPDSPGTVFVCSGAALSDTRFLTAAHCFDPALPVFVSHSPAAVQSRFRLHDGDVSSSSRLVSRMRP